MFSIVVRVFILAAAVALAAAGAIVLDSSNFDEVTAASTGEKGAHFVKFYAPWCGHCKKLAPAWEELADKLDGQVSVGKVDVTENRELGSRFGVTGFPTLILFKDGQSYKYRGPRDVEGLSTFALSGYAAAEATKVEL